MAIDEVLWEGFQKTGQPFFRLYSWNPACLSLGRFQNARTGLSDVAGLPTVRRITGGGAIWHDQEITYSLACSQETLGIRGVKASFEKLTSFLLQTWRKNGWDAGYAKDLAQLQVLGQPTVACFSGKEEYDIVVNGKKLGGNAQSRSRDNIFQHGSIPTELDFGFLEKIFEQGLAPSRLETTSLTELGWNTTKRKELETQLVEAFSRSLDADLFPDELTADEKLRVEEMKKIRTEDWISNGTGSFR